MLVFVTGASGYIGGQLCRRLAADDVRLRVLVRPTSRRDNLEELGAELVEGELTDRSSLREGMSGADWVIHAAALVDLDAPLEDLRRANVDGCENVASLAHKLGVGRLLAVSSIAFFGGSPADGSAATEQSPVQRPLPSNYARTKHQGELAIRRWEQQGLAVNTVYPSLVYGPPAKRSGINPLLRVIARGRLPALVAADRRVSWVHVDDVVSGICAVMERAEPGERFLLAGETASIRQVAAQVASIAGVRAPRWELPLSVAYLLARVAGRRLRITPQQVRSLSRHWSFDDSQARTRLGWQPRGLAEGLPETVRYLLDEAA